MSSPSPTTPPPSFIPPRTIIYIDGFNFYYGAVKGSRDKWLNLERFFKLLRPHDDLCQIHYFTAMITGPTLPNQQAYIRALGTLPLVNTILGNYKAKRIKCTLSGCSFSGNRQFMVNEEKRTDVNIAIQMLEDAYEDRCDKLILVSGDSDLVPAVIRVRNLGKKVLVYIPARDRVRGAAVELRSVADASKILPLTLLPKTQFPSSIPDGGGGIITKPASW